MNLVYRLLGKVFSSRLGFYLIKLYAFRTPHAHLTDLDGGLYMGRWRVIDEGTLGGKLLRLFTGFDSCRLHRICRKDHDRDLHNHPFEYRTFILDGWYIEVFQDDTDQGVQSFGRGKTATGSGRKFHRIQSVSDNGVWTLFFMTRNTETWGFLVGDKFVNSVRYLLRKGYPKDGIRAIQTRESNDQ